MKERKRKKKTNNKAISLEIRKENKNTAQKQYNMILFFFYFLALYYFIPSVFKSCLPLGSQYNKGERRLLVELKVDSDYERFFWIKMYKYTYLGIIPILRNAQNGYISFWKLYEQFENCV